MTIISTTVGKNPLEKNGVVLIVNKSPKCSTCVQSQKRQNDLHSSPRQTIQYHGNSNYSLTSNAEEAEVEWFYEDVQDLLELIPKKDVLFIIGDWNAKVGSKKKKQKTKTWSKRQIWLWSTKRSRSKANRILPRECTGHSKHPLPTTQEKALLMDITRW